MRKILIIFMLFIILGCREKYYGYVYDINTVLPLENVTVIDKKNNFVVKTDKNGYFEIIYDNKFSDELIFKKANYKTDTIPSFGCSNAGETSNSCFKGNRIYMKLIK